jgi:tRNA(fMet)-specific endonuclease VapC
MIIIDTDTLTLYFAGHPRVTQRVGSASEVPVISIISRIEVLQGRFDSILKAADAVELLRAHERLMHAERRLGDFAVISLNIAAGAEFDSLNADKKYRKIGRADLLISCIALANRATLITRNLRHFRQVPGLKLENWAD